MLSYYYREVPNGQEAERPRGDVEAGLNQYTLTDANIVGLWLSVWGKFRNRKKRKIKKETPKEDNQGTKFPDAGPLAMAVSVLAPVVILIGALFSSKRND